MHMGYLAACNLHQRMLERRFGLNPQFRKLDEIPPMIGLAVGRQAMAYDPDDGLSSGEDVMAAYFSDDLGLMSKSMSLFSMYKRPLSVRFLVLTREQSAGTICNSERGPCDSIETQNHAVLALTGCTTQNPTL